MALFGNVIGLENYRECARMAGMTSTDCNKLHVIHKFPEQIAHWRKKVTQTKDLLERKGIMSVMQMVVDHTLTMVHKC